MKAVTKSTRPPLTAQPNTAAPLQDAPAGILPQNTPPVARLPHNALVDLRWIARESGMSEKWFYKLIARGEFRPPMKLGRYSRWYAGDLYDWLDLRYAQSGEMFERRRAACQKEAS